MSIFSDPVLSGLFLKSKGWPLYTGLTVFYRDVLKYCTLRVLFFGRRNARNIDFLSLIYCKIMHLKARRKCTFLVASISDFVSVMKD